MLQGLLGVDFDVDDDEGELHAHTNDGESYASVYWGSKKDVLARLRDVGGGEDDIFVEAKRAFAAAPRGKVAYFSGIELAPSARKQRAGTQLVQRLLSMLRERGVKLIVLHADRSAAFWHQQGFSDCGVETEQWFMPVMCQNL